MRRAVGWGALLLVLAVAAWRWWLIAGAPEVTWAERAAAPDAPLLVDCRAPEDFAAGHAPGAVSLPYEAIVALRDLGGLPAALAGRPLHVVCYHGISSAVAVSHLLSLGVADARSVRGGMAARPPGPLEAGPR